MTAVSSARQYIGRLNAVADRHREKLWLLLLLSGILGAVEGIATATWQHPVETAQVLLGLVTYDHASLPYAYHVSLFSLLNYVAALFLATTHSEVISSILLAALLGILAMQTLAMVIHLIARNVYRATAIAAALMAINLFGTGISYPILFMGTEHAYGRAGLLFAVYAPLWLAFSRYRTGLFLCGLALGVHPAWGLWLNLALAAVALIRHREARALIVPANVLAYVAGAGITLALFAWQKWHYPVALPNTPADLSAARDIFLNYIRYWDHHRQKFGDPSVLAQQFFYAAASVALAGAYFVRRRKEDDAGRTIFFTWIIVSTLLSAPLVFVPSWFEPGVFPEWFVTLMPGRFIDISIFLCTPLLFAAVFGAKRDPILSSFPAQILAMLSLFVVARIQYGNRYATVLVLLTEGLVVLRYTRGFRLLGRMFPLGAPVVLLVCLSPLYLAAQLRTIEAAFARTSIPHPVTGSILTTMENYMIQAQTRVSSVTPHIDGYVYLRGAPARLALNQFTTDLFGIPLADRPPPGATLHESRIATRDFENLWEARSCEQWRQLAGKYHFGLIVVPAAMPLRLRRLDDDPQWGKYLPVCPI
jgi:hypothetical protein